MSKFGYSYESIQGRRAVVLAYRGSGKELCVKVAPELGNNVYCFKVGDVDVIHHDPRHDVASYFTGNPILYPIPNRCENCRYTFEGKGYWQAKNNVPIFLHSLVYDESWAYEPPVVTDSEARVSSYIKIDESHPVYGGFPFKHTLKVTYRLTATGLECMHEVHNEGPSNLPFGISYHTYLPKRPGARICVPARHVMEVTDALLPTGRLLDATGAYDLGKSVDVDSLQLDDCYTGFDKSAAVFVDYPDVGLQIMMDGTEDFTHVQVYTPPEGKPFFCAEMQTCGTDAINMAAKGYERESRLQIVKPGDSKSGVMRISYK